MKRIMIMAGVGLIGLGSLAACSGGVDRDGTRENLVEAVEASGGTVDEECVDDVFDKYSDDELKDFDDEINDSEPSAETQAFVLEVFGCITEG